MLTLRLIDHTTNLMRTVFRTYRLHDRLPPSAKQSMNTSNEAM